MAIAPDPSGVGEHGADVEVGGVVGVEGSAQVGGSARGAQVVGGAHDRVVRVVHVPAHPVGGPGRGDELHRALRAGGARVAHAAERRFDEVDGREHGPRDAEAPLGLAVVGEQAPRRLGRAGPVAAGRGGRDLAEPAAGADGRAGVGGGPGGQPRQNLARERRPGGEQQVDALLVERPERHLARRRVGAEVALVAPAVDGGGERAVGRGKALRESAGLARDRGLRRRSLWLLRLRLLVLRLLRLLRRSGPARGRFGRGIAAAAAQRGGDQAEACGGADHPGHHYPGLR